MIIFIKDLIAQSYLYNAKDKDAEIAQFFFEAQGESKHSKRYYYAMLISEIESLIENTYSKISKHNIDFTGSNQDIIDDINLMEYEDQQRYEESKDEAECTQFLEEQGIFVPAPTNWEECTDADKLTEAINNQGVVLKDPVVIIDPSKDFSPKPLVLRKSKLEYLKDEAIRAKNAESLGELDLVADNNIVLDSQSEIEKDVREAFAFTLREDPRKHQIILSQENFDNLVEWVTFYFEKDHELPKIVNPIMEVNTGKGNIRHAFKLLFDKIHPDNNNRVNLYALASKCFYYLSKDNRDIFSKSKKPARYDDLIKKP